ncbi:MAG: hypothetical protein QOJ64_3800 [Acidobacteriota bacterium]|nr:hypothetical protein [Acidobacteriota bacterium]
MKLKSAPLFPFYVVVCLFALLPASTLAQGKVIPKSKTAAKSTTAAKATPVSQTEAVARTEAPPKAANAPALAFISQLEQEIIQEMNLARTEPQKYAAFVDEYRKYYDGNRLTVPGRKKAIITNDGIAAVDEAVNFLRAQRPLPAFDIAKGMCSAAADHARDLAGKGIDGHRGSDGSTPNARVDRYGDWESSIGETIVYEVSTPRQIMIALIIDDGVPTRGHRRNIFDPNYKVTGISVSDPLAFGSKCVIDYVGGFKEKAPDIK